MHSEGSTTQFLQARFNEIMKELFETTEASRTTLRIDLPDHGFHVDDPVGEARAPDVPTLIGQPSLDQRKLNTVIWLDEHRRNLIQSSCKGAVPSPPQALIDIYGVQAQMLGPVILGDELAGWISVHENRGTRDWRDTEIAALNTAVAKVLAVVEAHT